MPLLIDTSTPGMTRLTFNRPDVRNALNPALIQAITKAVTQLPENTRVVILQGIGQAFCAGADLNWMRDSLHSDASAIATEAEQLQRMLYAIQQCPYPVLAYAHGGVYGGGIGILAACDVVMAHPDTQFCLSETRLGLIPAVIAPWVIRKMGFSAFNALTLTANVFSAAEAQRLGLVHSLNDNGPLNLAQQMVQRGPDALKLAKHYINSLLPLPTASNAIALITQCRQSAEGQEGMTAFLAKRSPNWCKPG